MPFRSSIFLLLFHTLTFEIFSICTMPLQLILSLFSVMTSKMMLSFPPPRRHNRYFHSWPSRSQNFFLFSFFHTVTINTFATLRPAVFLPSTTPSQSILSRHSIPPSKTFCFILPSHLRKRSCDSSPSHCHNRYFHSFHYAVTINTFYYFPSHSKVSSFPLSSTLSQSMLSPCSSCSQNLFFPHSTTCHNRYFHSSPMERSREEDGKSPSLRHN